MLKLIHCLEDPFEECLSCRETLDILQEDLGGAAKETGAEEKKTIDFLKKNRRRNIRITVISLAAAALIALVIVFINRYVAGFFGEAVVGCSRKAVLSPCHVIQSNSIQTTMRDPK